VSQSDRQLALTLAVQSLTNSHVERNHGEWVIELARKYEAFLEEKTENKFEVMLHNYGHSSLNTISLVKDLNGKNFTEVKDFISQLPTIIKSHLTFEEAISIRNQFFRLGATVTVEKCSTK
jgi:ribosomal protein L7/L12